MRAFLLAVLSSTAMLSMLAPKLEAQTPTQPAAPATTPAEEAVTTITLQVNEVPLIFAVTDKKGHFITGLKREDFGLLDDAKQPAAVLSFSQQTNLPLRVGIMLDTSSSIRTRFKFEQDAAVEFLMQTLKRDDRAFVEGFDIKPDYAQPYTNNMDLLNQGIYRLRPGGGTALFDSLYSTCKDQMLTLQERNSVRKALILVSDGDDNYSRVLENEAIKECQRADTIVYTISTNISSNKDKGDDVLRAIANATGGRDYFPMKLEDIVGYFSAIQEELRSQYLLVYRPADFKNDGGFRTILLRANDPRYQAHAKTGYFSPAPAK
jgi:VWFA-related protein